MIEQNLTDGLIVKKTNKGNIVLKTKKNKIVIKGEHLDELITFLYDHCNNLQKVEVIDDVILKPEVHESNKWARNHKW